MEYHDLEKNNCDNCIHHRSCKDKIEFDNLVKEFVLNSNANTLYKGLMSGRVSENMIILYNMKCRLYEKRGD